MKILNRNSRTDSPTVAALGTFDGMHRAHRKIIDTAMKLAGEKGYSSLVYTFRNLPAAYFGSREEQLFSEQEKTEYLEDMGVDILLMDTFDRTIAETDHMDFLNMLKNDLCVRTIVCGYDFRFGKDGRGDADVIRRFAEDNGMGYFILEREMWEDTVISSTNIRRLLKEGELEKAEELLGHPYFFSGTVIEGRKVGRTIGFPTVNLSYGSEKLLPPKGVYASKVLLNGKYYEGVTNIGSRPTVGNGNDITIETNLLDMEGDLYGKTIRLELYKYIRKEKRFSSLEELKNEIDRNKEQVRSYFRDNGR